MNTATRPAPGTKMQTSTGGTITYTQKGLIHTAGKNFSGRAAEQEEKPATRNKRG